MVGQPENFTVTWPCSMYWKHFYFMLHGALLPLPATETLCSTRWGEMVLQSVGESFASDSIGLYLCLFYLDLLLLINVFIRLTTLKKPLPLQKFSDTYRNEQRKETMQTHLSDSTIVNIMAAFVLSSLSQPASHQVIWKQIADCRTILCL